MERLAGVVLVAVCSLLAGCPESVHPVSDPVQAAHDRRLAGVWHGQFDGDEVFVHVGAAANGMSRAIAVWHKKKGVEVERYTAFPSRVDTLALLNVRAVEETGERGYTIFRYEIGRRRLTLWMLSGDAVRADIVAGKLKGLAGEGPFGQLRVTASSAELQTYLRESDPKRLFDKPLVFRRVAAP